MTDPGDEILSAIQAAFDEVLPEAARKLKRDDELLDLGVGSIAALEMAGLLEDRFGVQIPPGDLMEVRTVGEFAELIVRLNTPNPN